MDKSNAVGRPILVLSEFLEAIQDRFCLGAISTHAQRLPPRGQYGLPILEGWSNRSQIREGLLAPVFRAIYAAAPEMGQRKGWILQQHSGQLLNRRFVEPAVLKLESNISLERQRERVQTNGSIQFRLCFAATAHGQQQDCVPVMCESQTGVQLDGFTELGLRRPEVPVEVHVHISQRRVRLRASGSSSNA